MNKPIPREGFVEDEAAEAPAAAEPAAAPPPADEWPLVVKLKHKKISPSHGVFVDELIFREPCAGDIMKCGGNPVRVVVEQVTGGTTTWWPEIDAKKMILLMANLSGILDSILKQQMDPRDYNTCAYALQRFFQPDW